jgi:hypothetical protein
MLDNMTSEEPEARAERISKIRADIVQAINKCVEDAHPDSSPYDHAGGNCHCYANTMMALVSALADFIAVVPEVRQAEFYKMATAMLEQAYVANLTKGAL